MDRKRNDRTIPLGRNESSRCFGVMKEKTFRAPLECSTPAIAEVIRSPPSLPDCNEPNR
jgi:hypothetical protein